VSRHIWDVPREELFALYRDVLLRSASLTVAELRRQVTEQHVNSAYHQAIGILLVEEYAFVCGLGNDMARAMLFESEFTGELDRYAQAIRDAESICTRILGELRAAGFVLDTYPKSE
jgi:hypothetical protein